MIKIANGYCDFCLPYNEKQDVMLEILNEMADVGFKNVAIEQFYKHEGLSNTVAKGKDLIPAPVKLDDLIEKIDNKLNLYNRLTIIYSDPSVSHAMGRSQNYKKYHLIAALPTSESALQHSCQTFQGDIITYNAATIKIRLSRKFYYLAVRRNMFFEIKYTPAIVDASERRAIISRAQQYHMIGKSKGIIISSEAKNKFHVRSPFDISSLGLIFGLSEEQAKCSISTMGRKVILAAQCRRLGRTPVLMKYEDVDTSTSEEDDDFSEMEVDKEVTKKRKKPATNSNDAKKVKPS